MLQVKGQPKSNFRKSEFIEWFVANGVKPEMYSHLKVVEMKKLAFQIAGNQRMRIEDVFEEIGCPYKVKILWLPPYHCHFNPIELVWALVKRYFEAHVGRCKSEDEMLQLWDEALERITPEIWKACVRHVNTEIEKCYQSEVRNFADCTDYSQFQIKLEEGDFGVADDDDDDEDLADAVQLATPSRPKEPAARRLLKYPTKCLQHPLEENDIISISDDEEKALDMIQSQQEFLTTSAISHVTRLSDDHHLNAFFLDHAYSVDPVRCASVGRETAASVPGLQFAVKIDKTELHGSDLNLVANNGWLNDKVIDAYMHLLMQRSKEMKKEKYPSIFAFSTYFYKRLLSGSYPAVTRWTKGVDIFRHDLVAVPMNVKNTHWCLAVLDMRHKTFKIYDSLRGDHRQATKTLMGYFDKECIEKRKHAFPKEGWSIVECVQDAPTQDNDYDCGVFVLLFMEYLARNAPFDFQHFHSLFRRSIITYELLRKSLIPWKFYVNPAISVVKSWPAVPKPVSKRKRNVEEQPPTTGSSPQKVLVIDWK